MKERNHKELQIQQTFVSLKYMLVPFVPHQGYKRIAVSVFVFHANLIGPIISATLLIRSRQTAEDCPSCVPINILPWSSLRVNKQASVYSADWQTEPGQLVLTKTCLQQWPSWNRYANPGLVTVPVRTIYIQGPELCELCNFFAIEISYNSHPQAPTVLKTLCVWAMETSTGCVLANVVLHYRGSTKLGEIPLSVCLWGGFLQGC